MEACASAQRRGQKITKPGHEPRVIPPADARPCVKRQKNDAADAEAVAAAASRPTRRFVAAKGEGPPARAMAFRTRDLRVRQRTQAIAAWRGPLAAPGVVAPQGLAQVGRRRDALEAASRRLPDAVRELGRLRLEQIPWLDGKIGAPVKGIRAAAATDEAVARPMTMPGTGPIGAVPTQALAPPLETFRSGRRLAARLGLGPRRKSTGGKPRLGRTSRMGRRDIRRRLAVGAMTAVRWAARKGRPATSWLGRMRLRKPRMPAALALADKMARTIWAMATQQESRRAPTAAAA